MLTQDQINHDLDILTRQLITLKDEMDTAIRSGHQFFEVKLIHLQMKELSKLISNLNEQSRQLQTRNSASL